MKTLRQLKEELDLFTETTKHSHGANFGKHVEGCPRCHELKNGAAPVKWAMSRKQHDANRVADIRAHFASDHHKSGKCGPVCTYGEW